MKAMNHEHELHRRRRARNYGIIGCLAGVAALLFAVTMVKLGGNAANPSSGQSWGESLQRWVLK